MFYPVCNIELLLSEKQGIEIDYCPKCRGIWLDRGELEKIIERNSVSGKGVNDNYRIESRNNHYDDDDHYKHDGYKHEGYGNSHYKKKSFLGDLFDF